MSSPGFLCCIVLCCAELRYAAVHSHPILFCSQSPKQKLPEFGPSLRKSVP
ncbi:hypothetical protein FOWG_06662 [Fusarium oxysporum f. sp. lycopersici MN25]|nr:hypothetical protein FOWG_06662 [Fusarium oxysporum f. sp. lycopersici MN25]